MNRTHRRAVVLRSVEIHPLEPRQHLSATLAVVASFNQADGGGPAAAPYIDSAGNLFGAAVYGGASSDGVVYEIVHGSNTITPLASFDNINNGAGPRSSLIVDNNGNFFGTTADGGVAGNGTVFELQATSNTLTSLANFNGANGATPDSGLFNEEDGFLYGVTDSDTSGAGVYYRISLSSNTITKIAGFNSSTTGSNPKGQLVEDVNGNLFGTAAYGAAAGDGSVFEIPAYGNLITLVAPFDGANGATPESGVVVTADGTIYGATRQGGTGGLGVIYKIAPGSNTITKLADFNNANGATPEGGLLIDGSGNLFGATSAGGANNAGTVFELPAGSNTIQTVATFNVANGATPEGKLVADEAGHLFGVAYDGGSSGDGAVYEVTGTDFNPIPAFASIDSHGMVSVTGTAGDDSIVVHDVNNVVSVTMNGQTDPPFNGVTGIAILGGAGNDSISLAGVPTGATVMGAGGMDSIIGGAGNDSIRGGALNDTIGGAGGNDSIVGGGGNDSLKGGAGDDSILGGPNNDTLKGGIGNDTLYGGIGADSVNGNEGNDSIIAGAGSENLDGGPGTNIITGSITTGDLPDTINASSGADSLVVTPNDTILGRSADDTVMTVSQS